MSEDFETGPKSHERILARLDKMVASGRVTEAEAYALRAAIRPEEFEAAIRGIRLRHAGARLDAAVESGQMTQQEADGYRDGLANGEHSRSLRNHLTKLRRSSHG